MKGETIETRMNYVGLFGYWLQRNSYGKYVNWDITHGVCTPRKEAGWCMVLSAWCMVHGAW